MANDPKKIEAIFAENLRRLRKDRGFAQGELAERLGIALRTYQKFEYDGAWPSADAVNALANHLGCSPAEFFRDDSARVKPTVREALDVLAELEAEMDFLAKIPASVRELLAHVRSKDSWVVIAQTLRTALAFESDRKKHDE